MHKNGVRSISDAVHMYFLKKEAMVMGSPAAQARPHSGAPRQPDGVVSLAAGSPQKPKQLQL